MSRGRPRSTPLELQAVIVQDRAPVEGGEMQDLTRFMLPILVPDVDWDAVDGLLADGKQLARKRQQERVRELEDRIARLQEERLSLLREAV